MTIHVLSDVEVWFAEHRLRGAMNSAALNDGVDVQEVTVFGDTGKRRIAGLHDSELSVEGYYDSAIDKALYDNLALANVPVTLAPLGSVAGDRAYLMRALAGEYAPGAGVGEPFGFSFACSLSAGDKLTRGVIGHNGTVIVDGTGLAINLGAIAAGQRLSASLHVLSFTNGDPTAITIESDDAQGFGSPITRVTFDNVAAVGAQFKTLLTAVADTWWRVKWDVPAAGGPSVQFVVALGIGSNF